MHALTTRSPIIDNSFSNDHRDAEVFEFQHSPDEQTGYGLCICDPECQPAPSFQAGDNVNLHGYYDHYENFILSHFEYLQTS